MANQETLSTTKTARLTGIAAADTVEHVRDEEDHLAIATVSSTRPTIANVLEKRSIRSLSPCRKRIRWYAAGMVSAPVAPR